MPNSGKVSLDEVISNIGVGFFHYRLWAICGFGFSAAAIEVITMAFVFPELRVAPWSLSEFELGSLAMTISSGSILGGLTFGALADRFGRRIIFMTTVLIVVAAGFASSCAPGVYILGAMRFFVGFGYGGNISVDFTLYSELLPTRGRGRMMFALSLFWPIGQIITCLLAWYLIPAYGWRIFLAASVVPIAITALARPLIPESPRWLLRQGRIEEATDVCLQMAVLNGKSATEVGLEDHCELCLENERDLIRQSATTEAKDSWAAFVALFVGPLRQTTLGLFLYGVALNYVGYGTGTLMPTFIQMKGIPKGDMYQTMLLNSLAQIPGIFLASVGASTIGRLHCLRLCMLITALALFGFAEVHTQLHVTAFTMVASCFHEAGWSLFHVYVPEVYPTDVRAFSTGFLSAAGNIVSLSAPYLSAALLHSQVTLHIILTFSSIAAIGSLSAYFLLHIETKNRDLQDQLTNTGKSA